MLAESPGPRPPERTERPLATPARGPLRRPSFRPRPGRGRSRLNGFLKRLSRALIVAWGVSFIAFASIRLVPGDPVLLLAGDTATTEQIEAYREQLHLSGSIFEQYWSWAGSVLHGDLGSSLFTRQPVVDSLARTLPVTLWITAASMTVALLVAVPLGAFVGSSRRASTRQVFRIGSSAVLAVPVFVSGLILLLVFGVNLGLLPVAGYDPSFPANLRYLVLPGLSSGIAVGMVLSRILARSVQDTAAQEFVESAIVWGLPRRELFWHYLMRPSLAPTIGLLGYVIGVSLTGTVVVESVFNLPGVGTYLVKGVMARDYPVVEGSLLVFGFLVVMVNLMADTVSGLIDPRTTP